MHRSESLHLWYAGINVFEKIYLNLKDELNKEYLGKYGQQCLLCECQGKTNNMRSASLEEGEQHLEWLQKSNIQKRQF